MAGNWPLILVAVETIDGFEGLVTEIRDDNLWLVWRVGAQTFLKTYTLRTPAMHSFYSMNLKLQSIFLLINKSRRKTGDI